MTDIFSILEENAQRWPDRPALIATKKESDTTLTFAELRDDAAAFSHHLNSQGITRGTPVLVFVPMSLELYVVLLGVFRIGAVAVFLDPSSGLAHINACCAKLPPGAMVAIRPLRWLRPFVRGLQRIPLSLAPPALHDESISPPAVEPPKPEDPALITFTSGSTGAPKAAVRSHRFLIAQHEALKDAIQLEAGEVDLTTLPVFVLANLASGITSVLPDAKISHPGSVDAARIKRQTLRLAPSRTGGSPAFYQRLLADPDILKNFRKVYTGGAPVFPAFLQRLQEALPAGDAIAVYGSTEAEPIAHVACREISADDWSAMRGGKGLLTGKPVPEIRLRIIADQWGQSVSATGPISAGQPGEILVTGDHVLKGYLRGEGDEETKTSIDGEIWHRTGDAGYLDATGRLWLLGRCSAKVRDEKGLLYPFTVECVAMSFPFIHRAAFLRLNGRRLLVLETKQDISAQEEHSLKAGLAWAGLDEIRRMKQIPVDSRHNAKINYPKLVRKLSA